MLDLLTDWLASRLGELVFASQCDTMTNGPTQFLDLQAGSQVSCNLIQSKRLHH